MFLKSLKLLKTYVIELSLVWFFIADHPNIKALITHAGGLGLSEAVHCGVPVLAIPIYGDQAHNAGAARDSMIGEVLEYDDITTENVLKGLTNILEPK